MKQEENAAEETEKDGQVHRPSESTSASGTGPRKPEVPEDDKDCEINRMKAKTAYIVAVTGLISVLGGIIKPFAENLPTLIELACSLFK